MANIACSNKLLQFLLRTHGVDQGSDEVNLFLSFDEQTIQILELELKEKMMDKSSLFDLSELAELMHLIDSSEPSQCELLVLLPTLMQFCLPSSLGILRICDVLRKLQLSNNVRSAVLDRFKDSIKDCSPRYLVFPGNRESFVQYSVNGLPCPNAYTISTWIYLEPPSDGNPISPTGTGKSSTATLFKCRSPLGGIDCILMPNHQNNTSRRTSFSHSGTDKFRAMGFYSQHLTGGEEEEAEEQKQQEELKEQEFLITIRSMNIDSQTGTPDVFECTSTATFTYKSWYLLTFVHQQHKVREGYATGNNSNKQMQRRTINSQLATPANVTFYMNGSMQSVNDLPYPFSQCPSESQWIVGLGLRGRLASITMVPEALSPIAISLLSAAGPSGFTSLDAPLTTPLSSAETGYKTMSGLWGFDACSSLHHGSTSSPTSATRDTAPTNARHKLPLFSITANHFDPTFGSSLPIYFSGLLKGDMIVACNNRPKNTGSDSSVVSSTTSTTPSYTGGCGIVEAGVSEDWKLAWAAAGGCVAVIYMLFDACEVSPLGGTSASVASTPLTSHRDVSTTDTLPMTTANNNELPPPFPSISDTGQRSTMKKIDTNMLLDAAADRFQISATLTGIPTSVSQSTKSFSNNTNSNTSACVLKTMDLLCTLLSTSVDVREQFLQVHGYHLIALALHRLATTTMQSVSIGSDGSSSTSRHKTGMGNSLLTTPARASHGHPANTSQSQQPKDCEGLSCELVDKCFELCHIMGLDDDSSFSGSFSKEGGSDAAAAACQGLLFNFQLVWGYASIQVKEYLLSKFTAMILSSSAVMDTFNMSRSRSHELEDHVDDGLVVGGEKLLRYIGVQRILDVLKLYIASSSATASNPTTRALNLCVRLVTMTVNAAINQHELHQRQLPSVNDNRSLSYSYLSEIEMILYSLEETLDGKLVECLLQIICNLRNTAPAFLRTVLYKERFPETTSITLLTQQGLSLQVRRMTLLLMLWSLGQELEHLLPQILALKKAHAIMANSANNQLPSSQALFSNHYATTTMQRLRQGEAPRGQQDGAAGGQGGASGKARPSTSQRMRNSTADLLHHHKTKARKDKKEELVLLLRPLEKAWIMVTRMASMLSSAMTQWVDGATAQPSVPNSMTNSKPPSPTAEVTMEPFPQVQEDVLSDVFDHDGPLGHVHVWLVLPILASILSNFSLPTIQRTLMSLSVTLKTEDIQAIVLASFPDKSWIHMLVKIAIVGFQKHLEAEQLLLELHKQLDDLAPKLKEEVESNLGKECSEHINHTVRRQNEAIMECCLRCRDDVEVAETCVELALDALAVIMEKKLRYANAGDNTSQLSDSSWRAWRLFFRSLRSQTSALMTKWCPDNSFNSNDTEEPSGKPLLLLKVQQHAKSGVTKARDTSSSVQGVTPPNGDVGVAFTAGMPPPSPVIDSQYTIVSHTPGAGSGANTLTLTASSNGSPHATPAPNTNTASHLLSSPPLVPLSPTATHVVYSSARCPIQTKCIKRCIALFFQRLGRSTEGWSTLILKSVVELLSYVEDRELCYHFALEPLEEYEDQLSPEKKEDTPPAMQQEEERILLWHMLDMMGNLRRAATGGVLGGCEWNAVHIAMRITILSLHVSSEDTADRICHELLLILMYICEPWGASSSEILKEYLLLVFGELERIMKLPTTSEHLIGRYSSLVFSFMHHLSELRDSQMNSEKSVVPSHVLPILDALIGVENCSNVTWIFELVHVSLHASDVISFEEDDLNVDGQDHVQGFDFSGVEDVNMDKPPAAKPPQVRSLSDTAANNSGSKSGEILKAPKDQDNENAYPDFILGASDSYERIKTASLPVLSLGSNDFLDPNRGDNIISPPSFDRDRDVAVLPTSPFFQPADSIYKYPPNSSVTGLKSPRQKHVLRSFDRTGSFEGRHRLSPCRSQDHSIARLRSGSSQDQYDQNRSLFTLETGGSPNKGRKPSIDVEFGIHVVDEEDSDSANEEERSNRKLVDESLSQTALAVEAHNRSLVLAPGSPRSPRLSAISPTGELSVSSSADENVSDSPVYDVMKSASVEDAGAVFPNTLLSGFESVMNAVDEVVNVQDHMEGEHDHGGDAETNAKSDVVDLDSNPMATTSPSKVTKEDGAGPIEDLKINMGALSTTAADEDQLMLLNSSPPDTVSPVTIAAPPKSKSAGLVEKAKKDQDGWLNIRKGIQFDRVDTEQARLAKAICSIGSSHVATERYWMTLRRKFETEFMCDMISPWEWKLGVAHIGVFPHRHRVVLRPRYEKIDKSLWRTRGLLGSNKKSATSGASGEKSQSSEDNTSCGNVAGDNSMGKVLSTPAKEVSGLSSVETNPASGEKDGGDAVQGDLTALLRPFFDPESLSNLSSPQLFASVLTSSDPTVSGGMIAGMMPGEGWGLVGADGGEDVNVEGDECSYGVIGVADARTEDVPTVTSRADMVDTATLTDAAVTALHSSNIEDKPDNKTVSPEKDKVPASPAAASSFISYTAKAGNDPMNIGVRNEVEQENEKDLLMNVHASGRIETGPCHAGARRHTITHRSGEVIDKQVQHEAPVFLITPSGNYVGTLSFTNSEMWYNSTHGIEDYIRSVNDHAAVNVVAQNRIKKRRWSINHISEIHLRRYRLRDTALEIFFSSGKHRNMMVDFGHTKENEATRYQFCRALMSIAPSGAYKQWPSIHQYRLPTETKVQQKWVNGEISNFEYLMALNSLSGRTFNDLCQYPVVPWVIAQYSEKTIDLHDGATYRDLSKPMGAQKQERLNDCLDRYENLKENNLSDIPPFMYGSHYSTMVGVVLHYLVRLQPFAALHQEMQAGHFDVPDRLFSSIQRTYYHNISTLSEVKELTPEWFTLPDFLVNTNNYDLGVTQDGDNVGDVVLPDWARSPEEFVRVNRLAMESDYVSANLHNWIDLIFGYKQTGQAAVDAYNVFYHLTYYGAVNRDLLSEPMRKAIELQIAHFGSHPMQLFRSAHPAKKSIIYSSIGAIPRPMMHCFPLNSYIPPRKSAAFPNPENITPFRLINSESVEEFLALDSSSTLVSRRRYSNRVIATLICADQFICMLDTGILEVYRYGLTECASLALNHLKFSSTASQSQLLDIPPIAVSLHQRRQRFLTRFGTTNNTIAARKDKFKFPSRKRASTATSTTSATSATTATTSDTLIDMSEPAVTTEASRRVANVLLDLGDVISFSDGMEEDLEHDPSVLTDAETEESSTLVTTEDGTAATDSNMFRDVGKENTGSAVGLQRSSSVPEDNMFIDIPTPDQPPFALGTQDIVIAAERDSTHFDVPPRVLLATPCPTYASLQHSNSENSSVVGRSRGNSGKSMRAPSPSPVGAARTPSSGLPNDPFLPVDTQCNTTVSGMTSCPPTHQERHDCEHLSSIQANVHVTSVSHHYLSYGFVDGRIVVNYFDIRLGSVSMTAEFRCHRCTVVSVRSDSVPVSGLHQDSSNSNGINAVSNTVGCKDADLGEPLRDIIASLDVSGRILVWNLSLMKMTSVVSGNTSSTVTMRSVVPRRPLHVFQCHPPAGSLVAAHALNSAFTAACSANTPSVQLGGSSSIQSGDTVEAALTAYNPFCAMQCDISWLLGIVVVSNGLSSITIFSLERYERLNVFDAYVDHLKREVSCENHLFKIPVRDDEDAGAMDDESSVIEPMNAEEEEDNGMLFNNVKLWKGLSNDIVSDVDGRLSMEQIAVKQLILCHVGRVIVHLIVTTTTTSKESGEVIDRAEKELVASYALSGGLCGLIRFGVEDSSRSVCPVPSLSAAAPVDISAAGHQSGASTDADETKEDLINEYSLPSQLTYMGCLHHSDVIMAGLFDGTVMLLDAHNLHSLYSFQPHLHCQRYLLDGTILAMNGRNVNGKYKPPAVPTPPSGYTSNPNPNASGSMKRNSVIGTVDYMNQPDSDRVADMNSTDTTTNVISTASAIIQIAIGPNPLCPSVMTITTLSGNIYLHPFPDFITWSNRRGSGGGLLSSAAPIISMVRGSIHAQAQNIASAASDAAGVLASNANVLASNAKIFADGTYDKLNNSKILKGVGTFFGGWGGKPK